MKYTVAIDLFRRVNDQTEVAGLRRVLRRVFRPRPTAFTLLWSSWTSGIATHSSTMEVQYFAIFIASGFVRRVCYRKELSCVPGSAAFLERQPIAVSLNAAWHDC